MIAVCVPAPAVYAIVAVPLRTPVAVGVKVTVSVQDALAASDPVQVVLPTAKSPAVVNGRLSVMAVVALVFLSVTSVQVVVALTAALGQVADAGVTERAGAAATPLPERFTDCGLVGALSVILSVPVRGPVVAPGVNETPMLHDAPAASVAPHVVRVASVANGATVAGG
jgi:hypothetical protein